MKVMLGLAALMTLGAAAPAEPAADAAALNWMAGNWGEEKGDRWTEEHWMAPRGGVMLGVNRSGKAAKASGFEFIRIAPGEGGTLTYFAGPQGERPVPFKLTGLEEQSALFENPAHDYPTRIRYWREGKLLKAEISGPDGANAMGWSFRPI